MMIKVQPFDTLFFRDGKPFTIAEETWADTIFPPLPSTIYGAMRTAYIVHNGGVKKFYNGKMKDTIGTTTDKGNFKIRGVYIQKEEELYFSGPLDIVYEKGEKKDAQMMRVMDNPLSISNFPLNRFLFSPGSIKKAEVDEKAFIGYDSLSEYLNCYGHPFTLHPLDSFIKTEPKVGIKRSAKTHISEEGCLYRVGMMRLEDKCSLIMDFSGLSDFPEEGILRLGGEGKGARFKKIKEIELPVLKDETLKRIKESRQFKLYLATPTIFKKGWLPDWIDEDTLKGELCSIKLKLLTAAIGKPISIGGWDMANNRPKPMKKAVPAGSVYYFEVVNGDTNSLISKFHCQNISDELKEEGFGLSFVGGV
jgi:CRISPR-associated protein Cmr3